MRISWQKLHHLPVETESGMSLGKVSDVVLNVESHLVESYEVKRGLLNQSLVIDPVSVVSITADKMIVKDAVVPEVAAEAVPTV